MPTRRSTLAPALVAGATVVLALTSNSIGLVRGESATRLLSGQVANAFQSGLVLGLVAAWILRDAPGNRLGPLMAGAATCVGFSAACDQYAVLANERNLPGHGPAGWLAGILWAPGFVGLLVMVPLLFPDGRIASPRWRWPARLATASVIGGTVLFATTQQSLDDNDFGVVHNPFDLPVPDDEQLAVAGALLLGALVVALAAIVSVLLRLRHVPAPQRPRYAWFGTAVLLALVQVLSLPAAVTSVVNVASFAALGIGIMRHGLFDIEPVLPRALVYGSLVAMALASYLVVAAAVGQQVGSGLVPALATAVVALLLARLQGRMVAGLTRVLYGERDDPDGALTRMGDRLAASLGTRDALPAAAGAVHRTLRVPYVGIRLVGDSVDVASIGTDGSAPLVELPLLHAGTDVGTLRIAPRTGERHLSGRDTALLARFTPHLAAVAHEIRTGRELQRSREQLVTLREVERARIHRDLHDGLGPALAGISLGLETATRATGRDPDAAGRLLEELRGDVAVCVDEVRRIVADLRPMTLDEGGLVGALKRRADLLVTSSGNSVGIDVRGDVGLVVPPAVEVAAYRIAGEAMTNAVRHAHPRHVAVQVDATAGALRLRVEDDGTGAAPTRRGTGLESMRLRAQELGGECTVGFREGAGTRVDARLPLDTRIDG
jgi:signal transduction histidine kinase